MTQPVTITTVGMVSSVGLSAPASCAAIRSGISNTQETRFMDEGKEWLMGHTVPLEQPWRGRTKLIKMAATAIRECLEQCPQLQPASTPLILCLAEIDRPGRLFEDNNAFFLELQQELGICFHEKSRVITLGRVSIGVALKHARTLIHTQAAQRVLIAATDSLLVTQTLTTFQAKDYILTSQYSDGFIPGEAAASVVIEPVYNQVEPQLICMGLGFGLEPASIDTEEPLRAEGLTMAIKQALQEANLTMEAIDFRISDIAGKQFYFKEASLALSKTLRERKEAFHIWHPAACIGETGAAIGLINLIVCRIASEKNYALGKTILCHLSADTAPRTAIILRWQVAGQVNGQ